ncbi:hypothetical protein C8034_v001833 [Colletotrichum sidae]|uniref:Uncharacterized protein n=1 Tax=Colletotrichum sidae TaxID=1347389 RepID=A0A4R8TDK3_9PEZI|nr:hypothetical protein C8034_v001833 [Colletotrichum sidae]
MLYNMSYPHDHPGAQAGHIPPVKPSAAAAAAAARPRPRCSQPMPFDPEELSQKLAKVLADQKLHAERRRRARAEAAAAASGGAGLPLSPTYQTSAGMARDFLDQGSLKPNGVHRGHRTSMIARPRTEPAPAPGKKPSTKESTDRPKSSKSPDADRRSSSKSARKSSGDNNDKSPHGYVPQFAASQFARTTTADNDGGGGSSSSKGLVHKLSRTALRIAQAHRERHQQERKNFYSDRTTIPESPTHLRPQQQQHHQPQKPQHRHTIEGNPGGGVAATDDVRQNGRSAARRVSTGDLLMTWDSGQSSPNPYGYDSPDPADHDPNEHRVDWSQSDETAAAATAAAATRSRPQKPAKHSLRKADSIWALKNKLGAFTKHRQEEHQQQQQQHQQHASRDSSGSPPSDPNLRSPKSGFFSRFKVTH